MSQRLVPRGWLLALEGLCLISSVFGASISLAPDGSLTAEIVLPQQPCDVETYAAEELKYHLGKAFGRPPAVVSEGDVSSDGRRFRFFIGRTEAAKRAGLLATDFAADERWLKTVEGGLCLLGCDKNTTRADLSPRATRSCGTLYAVYDFLEKEMSVKWLWPGELGEVIPARKELAIGEIDRRVVEPLFWRGWAGITPMDGFSKPRMKKIFFDAQDKFLIRHHVGRSANFRSGHSFRDWWKRFSMTHPEYFNLLPNGKREPLKKGMPHYVTMCVTCPGVWAQKIADWEAEYERAKSSPHPLLPWVNCCENDSSVLCTCPACRAWDGPDPRFEKNDYWNGNVRAKCQKFGDSKPFRELAKDELRTINDGRTCMSEMHPTNKCPASVSDRIARFYNVMLAEARKKVPDARVVGYAYENYIEAPLVAKVDPGVLIIFVPRSFFPYDQEESDFFRRHWAGWRKAGVKDFVYRPNYTLAGGNYPIDFARLALDDFAFAATNGMVGCYFDSLLGAWSSQAMSSYAITRAMREPCRGYAKAREDMLSGFGSAAAAVNRYFDAIEAHTMKWTYDDFRAISFPNNMGRWTGGSFPIPASVLGDFYTDGELAELGALLDEAHASAGGDKVVEARVEFLRKGLRDTVLTRNCRIAQKRYLADEKNKALKTAFEAAFKEMKDYRTSVEGDFVCNYARNDTWERDWMRWPHPKPPEKVAPAKPKPGDRVQVDFSVDGGAVKPLHGVNNSPVRVRPGSRQHEFAAAGIPFMRTHDTAGGYGGAHYIDIPNLFRDFAADENDPSNYDFALTDAYLKPIVEAGTEIFFRLGTTIENNWRIKAYNIKPPVDFAKWARVCEHVVRHYNEGWANGFRWNIRYWEIWNEPENPPMWSGTREQFFELYRVTANHLKGCFPGLKVGGYAGCGFYAVDDKSYKMRHNEFYQGFVTWFEDFCRYVTDKKTKAPLDFFSWHLYLYEGTGPDRIATHADYVRKTLDAAGLTSTESIFDEWNWNPKADWMRIKGHEGAAVMAAAFAVLQKAPVDKAMYYDALPTRGHCGLFFFPNIEPTPTYYSFLAFNELYRLGTAVKCEAAGNGLYVLAAKGNGNGAVLLANISDKERRPAVSIDGYEGDFRRYRIAKGDDKLEEDGYWERNGELVLPPSSVVLLTTKAVDVAAARRPDVVVKTASNGLDDGRIAPNPNRCKRLEVRELKPVAVFTNASGHVVADFGAASFGWLEMHGKGAYSIVIGEMTNVHGVVTNSFPSTTIRAQRLSGKAPSFRYRIPMPADPVNVKGYDPAAPAVRLPEEIGVVYPFRFAEVEQANCAAGALVQKVVNYPIDMSKSRLESDNTDIVRLYDFCKHTIRATSFCGVYVDGDRERTPYEADAYINQLCHYAIDNDYALARKSHEWLMDHPTWPTEWKQHSVMMAWADWMWTGDTQSLARFYDKLKSEKLDAGCKMRADGLLVSPGGTGRGPRDIVDWPLGERDGFTFTTVNAVVNAFRYRNLREMADIAKALGEPDDARRFAKMADQVKASYGKAFYNQATGLYVDGEGVEHSSLHANAAALAFGLVPADRRGKIADFLVSKGMACSVYFAQYLLEALYAAGRGDAAMRLMLAHGDRSWIGMMDFGATMTMEAWSVKAKPNLDLNHAWGAVPLNIIARYVLGVTPLEPGFAKISIRPDVGGLQKLKGVVPTAKGPVVVEIEGNRLTVETKAPARVEWKGKSYDMAPGTRSFVE